MKYLELLESMSFSAGHKNPDEGYWESDTDSGDVYTADFYKDPDKYMGDDEEAVRNPNYKPELDLTLSNANMREVFAELGYPTDLEDRPPLPIDEFIGVSTQWLKKNIGKPSPEEPTTIDKNPAGPTMISGGKPEGYMNQQVKLHNELARKIKSK